MVYKLFDIISAVTLANKLAGNTSGGAIKSEITSNQQLAQELQKPIIRKFKTC